MKIRSLALCLLAAAACRSSSSSNTPDAPNGNNPDAPNGGGTTIYDIQDPSNKVAVGAMVDVHDVVVTAIDAYGAKTGAFWIEEKAGGAYSGVEVFNAPAAQVAALKVGDVVTVTGAEKAEFALASDTSGRTTTELEPPKGGAISVTKTADGTVPDAAPVDALAIGMMAKQADQDAEWEKWEGVRIKVSSVAVISSAKPVPSKTPDPTFQSFDITGPLTVESSLAAFPTSGTPAVGPQFGDCLGSITGIGDYFFQWNLLPTATADVASGGSGCPAAETGSACTDTIDNDANGHADCLDYSCMLDQTQQATCIKGVTVHDVDTGAQPVGTGVKLATACVTAVDSSGKNLWVADAGQAAVDTGVYVFRGGNATAVTGIAQGTQVSVDLAVVSPYHGLMELAGIPGAASGTSPGVTNLNGQPCKVTALATTLATLADTTMTNHYAGSLVTLSNVKVTATTGTGAKTIYTLSDGTKTIEMGVQIFDPKPQVNVTCYATLTGIATWDTSPNPSVPMILPTLTGAVPGGTCP
jgi:hypothetical protein